VTQLIAPDLLDPVTLSMARDFNRLINGSMEVAQRGSTSLTTGAGAYTLDRWRVADSDASCSGTVAQAASTTFGSGYCMQVTASHTSGILYVSQRVESVVARSLVGDTGRLTATVLHDFGSAVAVYLDVYTANTADNFAAVTTLASSAGVSVPSGVATALTLDVPFGTGNVVNGLLVQVRTAATSVTSKNFYLGDVVLSEQAVTGGNRRPRQVEALLCDRYFQRNVPMGGRGFSTGAGQAAGSTYTLRTTMRAAPTITPVVGVQSNVDTLSYHAQSAAGGCVTIPSAASGDFYWFGSVTADAEL